MSCPGGPQDTGQFFGTDPIEVLNDIGYADFLYSITDTNFLFREGAVMETSDFLDSQTASAKLILVFFTPSSGVTS
eukprot:CAMPEP_0184313852 /NCGR_PEP_ID=MMETSP1049-20130417/68418_1 /TAXON_ID=77928 /ORGANISM="Proteomonas sulcata, Strain CCMP704" /LENGTH=75 /DNA_ID=CAMNT_0026631419 /DNA_START=10 /DNA_END=234 /DNA_ORIENTATION=+